jgi:DNA polymerase-3 subunit delta
MKIYLLNICYLHLIDDEIEKIVGNTKNVIRINLDESNIHNIIEECSYYSLLNEEKIVIVNNFKLNDSTKDLLNYLDHPNPNTTLILITDKIDKRNAIYKFIKDKGTIIEINDLKVKDLIPKINNYCHKKDISIEYSAVTKLLDNNLNNYDLALNEINKISILKTNIKEADINKYDEPILGDDTFALCDAITNKDKKKTLPLLENFISSKNEVIPLVALLASQYRIIYAAKCMGGSPDTIAAALDIHPYRVKLAIDKSYLYTKEEILNNIISLCDLDFYLKSKNVDEYSLLKMFLINL